MHIILIVSLALAVTEVHYSTSSRISNYSVLDFTSKAIVIVPAASDSEHKARNGSVMVGFVIVVDELCVEVAKYMVGSGEVKEIRRRYVATFIASFNHIHWFF